MQGNEEPASKKPAPSPSPVVNGNGRELGITSEQDFRMKQNKMEAESKLYARRLGTPAIGVSWMQVLLPEFKKSYMKEVNDCCNVIFFPCVKIKNYMRMTILPNKSSHFSSVD